MWLNDIVILGQISENCRGNQRVKVISYRQIVRSFQRYAPNCVYKFRHILCPRYKYTTLTMFTSYITDILN